MRNIVPRFIAICIIVFLAAEIALAQNSQNPILRRDSVLTPAAVAQRVGTVPPAVVITPATQAAASLSTLPEADTLIYVNVHRILNEALPKFVPEKDLAGLQSAFNEVNQHAGVDPSKLDYFVIAVRFHKPSQELKFLPPDLMLVASGGFAADSLILLAKSAAADKLHDEKYGSKTLSVLTIDDILKLSGSNPLLKSFSEVAIVPLSNNSIAVGSPAYLRAAVDAAEGRGRMSAESLNSLLRDSTALISVAGSPLTSFKKSFGLLGTENNPRGANCNSKFGDFYAAVTMDATNILLRGAMNADNSDTAKIITYLLSGLMQQAANSVPDKNAQSALKALSITAPENEVLLSATIPQQLVGDFIRDQTKPAKKEVEQISTPPPAKKQKSSRRRRHRS